MLFSASALLCKFSAVYRRSNRKVLIIKIQFPIRIRIVGFRGNVFLFFLKPTFFKLVLTNYKNSEADIESCSGKKLNLDKTYKTCLSAAKNLLNDELSLKKVAFEMSSSKNLFRTLLNSSTNNLDGVLFLLKLQAVYLQM